MLILWESDGTNGELMAFSSNESCGKKEMVEREGGNEERRDIGKKRTGRKERQGRGRGREGQGEGRGGDRMGLGIAISPGGAGLSLGLKCPGLVTCLHWGYTHPFLLDPHPLLYQLLWPLQSLRLFSNSLLQGTLLTSFSSIKNLAPQQHQHESSIESLGVNLTLCAFLIQRISGRAHPMIPPGLCPCISSIGSLP